MIEYNDLVWVIQLSLFEIFLKCCPLISTEVDKQTDRWIGKTQMNRLIAKFNLLSFEKTHRKRCFFIGPNIQIFRWVSPPEPLLINKELTQKSGMTLCLVGAPRPQWVDQYCFVCASSLADDASVSKDRQMHAKIVRQAERCIYS